MTDFKFNLDSIALIKANFSRHLDLSLYNKDSQPEVSVKVTHTETIKGSARGMDVLLNVDVSVRNDNSEVQIEVNTEMLGAFTITGEPPHNIVDYFGNINAPAIIFPFIREVIANLTVKSNISPILLPAMNFVTAYEESISSKAEEKDELPKAINQPVKPRAKRTPAKSKQAKED